MITELNKAKELWVIVGNTRERKKEEQNIQIQYNLTYSLECVLSKIKQHLQDCEDTLWFLNVPMSDFMNINGTCFRIMDTKIKDLKSAIAFHKEKLK